MYITALAIDPTCLFDLLKWTADGPGTARALQLAVSGLIAKLAATLSLPMAAKIVWARHGRCATRKLVKV